MFFWNIGALFNEKELSDDETAQTGSPGKLQEEGQESTVRDGHSLCRQDAFVLKRFARNSKDANSNPYQGRRSGYGDNISVAVISTLREEFFNHPRCIPLPSGYLLNVELQAT